MNKLNVELRVKDPMGVTLSSANMNAYPADSAGADRLVLLTKDKKVAELKVITDDSGEVIDVILSKEL